MGKAKRKKRMMLRNQIIAYYVRVIAFTIVTSLILIITTYFIYHSIVGFHSLDLKSPNVSEVIEYASENSRRIIRGELKEELYGITAKYNLDFYLKDMENHILYGNSVNYVNTEGKNFFINLFHEMLNHSIAISTINIPLVDPDIGKASQILVLTQNENTYMTLLILVDICIPTICLIVYTLIFSKSLSRDIKKPLDKLMMAVERIKAQDLEFSIKSDCDNEIGDLARAFEEMRENLKESLIREWKLEQDRREMVAAITHDLRTPIAIIQGHVEGLQDGLYRDKDKLDAYLDIIEQNSWRAKNLISEMNSLIEIDSISFELCLRKEDIAMFLQEKIDEIKVLLNSKKIDVEVEISDSRSTNRLILIDSDRLSQVINNLIGNSIRYTPHGGIIKFHGKIEESKLSIRICDSGKGFSEKDLNNLFKKFYKGDSARSKEKGHSGLGLYIAKTIIEKHGGAIKAFNLSDGGACVDFFITYE